ncbi:MAG: GGDEF domain-containing protein [Rubrivivax sp.]|nr:GGDEF domain-containing protein [Rubrivivax sp.]
MTNSQLLLAVILIQQGLFGAVWAVAARLGLSRRPARHWAAASGLVVAGMSLMLARGQASPWLTMALANALLLLSFVLLRRGLQIFGRLVPTDREHTMVMALAVAGVVGAVAVGNPVLPVVIVASIALGWTLLRSASEVRRSLESEFGRGPARWCALPGAVIGSLFVLRGSLAPLLGPEIAGPISDPGSGNVTMVIAALIFGLVINTMLFAMTIVRLVRRLQYQSDHDVLTDLLSRRAMERLLEAEAQRQRRFGTGYAVLSIDIDHFKQINDRWGHATGDAVLVQVAHALRDASREVDRVARTGGEEFCVLLPGVDKAGAERAAQRLLQAVRELEYRAAGPSLRVTVSIGLAIVGHEAEPLPALLRRLDQALYAAKHRGRDRVESAAPAAAG